MKSILLTVLLWEGVTAFPAVMTGLMDRGAVVDRTTTGCSTSAACNKVLAVSNQQIGYDPNAPTPAQKVSANRNQCGFLTPCTFFNAERQLVSTSGKYQYQAPGPSDIRGPCPGLNAAANHGYLPRSGVATIPQTIAGLGAMYGMSIDLAGFLAAYAVAIDGDILSLSWSIGGPSSGLGLIPTGQGISYSHNKYEGDSSMTRCDAYMNNGDAHSLSPTRFADAYASGMDNDRYTFDKFSQVFTKNTVRSEAQNPLYFAPLFSTTLVSPAAYNFVIAMMSNHTASKVDGYLDGSIFKSFFAITGTYPNFKWNPGQERMPENWYRRPLAEPYTAHTGVFGDLAAEFLAYPRGFRFGGNSDGVGTYTGVDLTNFTNGVYTAENLFKGNNLACFAYQSIQQGIPDAFSTLFNPKQLAFLAPYLTKAFGAVSCPQVSKFNNNNLPPYPGQNYSPTGPATSC